MIIVCSLLLFFVIKNKRRKKLLSPTIISEIMMIILLFIINLRIMIPSDKALVAANNLDIIFVVDNSISMIANDYQNNKTRLDGVKELGETIIKELNGARFTLITFDNSSKVIIPFTKDSSMALESIEVINTKAEYRATGSSLNAPKEDLLSTLKSSKETVDRIPIVFFISDGEITREDQPLESFKDFKEYIENGAILGFGTEQGATMYIGEKGMWGEYVMANYGQEKAISKMNEANLKKIAEDMDLDYIHISNPKDIQSKIKELKTLASSSFQSSDKSTYEDTYYIFLIPLFLLLLFHFREYKEVYQ